jgi:exosome complex RNA-binding protein Rrp4
MKGLPLLLAAGAFTVARWYRQGAMVATVQQPGQIQLAVATNGMVLVAY